MTDTDQKQNEILSCLADALSALYTQQAIITELLSRALPSISESERKALEDNAKSNYEIADTCLAITKQIQEM